MKKTALGLIGLAIACGLPLSAEDQAVEGPRLEVTVAPDQARVGDLVEATLTLHVPPGYGEPTFPNWQQHWGRAEIRQVGEVLQTAGPGDERVYSQILTVTAFRPGAMLLPPPSVTVAREDTGEVTEVTAREPTNFDVVSILPEQEEAHEPKPAARPLGLPLGTRFWWTVALLTALVAALASLLFRQRRVEGPSIERAEDPWTAFQRALARLAQSKDPETVFTGLSLEFRRFLGSAFAFPAAESTTTEIKKRLRTSGLSPDVGSRIVALLVEADGVKFAKRRPEENRTRECLGVAQSTGEQIRSFLEPVEDPAADQSAGEERAA